MVGGVGKVVIPIDGVSEMTTTVSVSAHCRDELRVQVKAVDADGSTYIQAELSSGESYTAYATDTRRIEVSEVPAPTAE